MPAGKAHRFHRHPEFEEILYVLDGRAKQWVGRELRVLRPGELAHVPRDVVHGTARGALALAQGPRRLTGR
jgi:quercetin dioxygenase-like cupin family protein